LVFIRGDRDGVLHSRFPKLTQYWRYRMVGTQGLLAIAISSLLAGIPGGAKPEVLGIILVAEGASLSGGSASEGTSVYDGDRLSTEADGTLQLRSGGITLALGGGSSVVVRSAASGVGKEFDAELASGTVTLSAVAEAAAEIEALGARIRPVAKGKVVVQVRIVGAKKLLVSARRGSVQVFYGEESEMILEGKSYYVLLDPVDGDNSKELSAQKAGKRGGALVLIAVAVAAAAVGPWILIRPRQQYESPDKP
jgi:hypothetical protein